MPESATARLYLAIPIIGPLTRAAQKDIAVLWYVMLILLTALVLAVQTWGLVALTMTALAAVPVMFTVLIILSRP